MLPVEFVVLGTPISGQGNAEARRMWKQMVVNQVPIEDGQETTPNTDAVALRVAYFYVDEPAADLDNIVKPIQDALKGTVYIDDIQVIDLVASMRPKVGNYDIAMTPLLATGFGGGSDFVYFAVETANGPQVLK